MTSETESLPFSVTIKGEIGVRREGDSISLIQKLEAISELRNGEMTLDGITKLPANLFTDEETVQQWTQLTADTFKGNLIEHLLHQTVLQLNDALHFSLDHLEIEPVALEDIVEKHIRNTASHLKHQFGLRDRGAQSKWERLELSRAVTRALRELKMNRPTYANVAQILVRDYRDKAPPNGEALRKMLIRFKISWTSLIGGRKS
jgi:hypothetical protein